MSTRKYCRVAGRGLRPVMADHRNKIRRASQQERKVRASTILKFNSSYCSLKEFGGNSDSKQGTPFAFTLRTQKKGAGATKRKCHFEWNALKADGHSACTDTCSPRLLRSNLLSFGEIKEFQLSSAWKRDALFFFFYVIYDGIAGNWSGEKSQNCPWGLNDQNLSFRNFASSFFFFLQMWPQLKRAPNPFNQNIWGKDAFRDNRGRALRPGLLKSKARELISFFFCRLSVLFWEKINVVS